MSTIYTVTKIVAKVLEIVHWVAAGLTGASALCAFIAPQFISYLVGFEPAGETIVLDTYGFEVITAAVDGMPDMTVFGLYAAGSFIILLLMAMVFRNLSLILKKSEGTTPFQKDNVRMLREIGIFSIAVPVVGFVMGFVIRIVAGFDAVEISNGMDGFIMGILVLCLTQVFAHGVSLEDDVEGLL